MNNDINNNLKENSHPWRRYFARVIDLAILGALISSIRIFIPYNVEPYYVYISSIVNIALWVVLETIIMGYFGTTIGKFILNIYVRDREGNKISYRKAFKRSLLIWIYGYGFGIPIVSVVTLIKSYNYLEMNHITKWDEKGGLKVIYDPINAIRVVVTIIILIGLPFGLELLIIPRIIG